MGDLRLSGTMGAEASFREEDIFGREEELSVLTRAALEGSRGIGSSFMIYGPPNIGKTSLLLKLTKALGAYPDVEGLPRPFPLYFSFSQILSHPLALSQHFLQEFLSRLLRFFGDTGTSAFFDPAAMCDRLASFGVTGCREVLDAHVRYTAAGDGLSALVNALSFPFSASGEIFYPVFLFDDFQYTGKLQGVPEGAMLSILRPYIKSGHFPMVLSGSSPGRVTSALKREGLFGTFQLMEIGGLSPDPSVRLWGHLCERRRVDIPASLLPRASERLGGIPVYQRILVEEIFFRNTKIPDVVTLENLYAVSVTEGRLNRYWREFFENTFPDRVRRGRAIRFLKRVLCDRFPLDTVEGAISLMGTSEEEGEAILSSLEFKGLMKIDLEQLTFIGDPVLADFLYWAFERGVLGKGTSQVAAEIVQARLSQTAPEAAQGGDHARRVEIVKELMRKWDLREVPLLLFDFGKFREKFGKKGLLEVVIGMERESARIRLPKVSSVSTGYRVKRGGPRFDFDLVAYGFLEGDFSEENLVVWAIDVAVEKNLGARAVEHFENRSRLLALEKGLSADRLRKWMVINETADPAAVDLATGYGIHLSHPTQLRLFLNLFGLEELERDPEPVRASGAEASNAGKTLEYELVLPIKADSEVVAARVAEEVATFASVDADTVDRIKMAIIEACINAFEHSSSESGKVRLRYLLSPDRIDIYVQDDGKGFRPGKTPEESKKNRGWGLKLIRELVDDVEINTGPDGTIVRMVKYLGADPGNSGIVVQNDGGLVAPEER
jgi:anti-sigma regulatory factor (Ser/Thr protein kinase)